MTEWERQMAEAAAWSEEMGRKKPEGKAMAFDEWWERNAEDSLHADDSDAFRRCWDAAVAAERERCAAVVRGLQAECDARKEDEVFAINRMQRAIVRIEGGAA